MSKSLNLQEVVRLIMLLFILPACTCFGTSLDSCNIFPYSPTCSTLADNSTQNNGVPLAMNCANVRLTSPRGGMANGVNTIYWDPLAGAVNYRINIYSGALLVGSWEASAPVTNLQADLSQNAIGGTNPFELELLAYDAKGNYCQDYVMQDREAYHYVDPYPDTIREEEVTPIVCDVESTEPKCL